MRTETLASDEWIGETRKCRGCPRINAGRNGSFSDGQDSDGRQRRVYCSAYPMCRDLVTRRTVSPLPWKIDGDTIIDRNGAVILSGLDAAFERKTDLDAIIQWSERIYMMGG